jgi:hypothetical protein
MNKQLRRLRGVVGLGLTWGIAWAVLFALLVLVIRRFDPDSIDAGEGPLPVATLMGSVGFVSGVVFGLLLALVESGRPILDLSSGRAVMWGVLAAAAFPLLAGREDQVLVFCPLGAALAAALVAIARNAKRHDADRPRLARNALGGCVLALVRDAVEPLERPSI